MMKKTYTPREQEHIINTFADAYNRRAPCTFFEAAYEFLFGTQKIDTTVYKQKQHSDKAETKIEQVKANPMNVPEKIKDMLYNETISTSGNTIKIKDYIAQKAKLV